MFHFGIVFYLSFQTMAADIGTYFGNTVTMKNQVSRLLLEILIFPSRNIANYFVPENGWWYDKSYSEIIITTSSITWSKAIIFGVYYLSGIQKLKSKSGKNSAV